MNVYNHKNNRRKNQNMTQENGDNELFNNMGHKKNAYKRENDENSPRLLKYRVFGYSLATVVHLANILAMFLALRGPIMKDPDVAHFYSMEFHYLTIWNLVFQLLYFAMGLGCDVPVLLKMRNISILNYLRAYRGIFLSGILWPCTVMIFSLFWPIYIYDRNLIFPEYIDKVLSQASNYVIHMFIIIPVLWELFFFPNKKPKSHKLYLGHTLGLTVIYFAVIFILYALEGKWPYPVLYILYGTIYFPILFVVLTVLIVLVYFVQWPLLSYIWNKRAEIKGR